MKTSSNWVHTIFAAMPFVACCGLTVLFSHRHHVLAASTPTYTITVITAVPSASCNGLNAAGQTTGQINGTGAYFAMVNTDGVITNLGSLNGSQGSVGQAFNNSAQVVGWSYINDSSFVTHNFIDSDGKMIDLSPFSFSDPAWATLSIAPEKLLATPPQLQAPHMHLFTAAESLRTSARCPAPRVA